MKNYSQRTGRVTYINRLKVVLAEKHLTNKWLADKLGKDQGTVSKWCTNRANRKDTLREYIKRNEVVLQACGEFVEVANNF